ncbi:MAG: FAD-binding oxidoreductase [Gammaproteobacteria bacterium]|nr:FAD-binding oxidoreductase [Gammaproteobacteria bacterium]MYC52573.1 FAD-binding oxidoreductase [Gammaproteobacteria bacterium]
MSLEALEDASAVRDDEGGKEPAGGEANPGDAPAMNGGAAAVARATEAGGAPVVAPRTVGELSNLIARASRDGRQVRFIGNATSLPAGYLDRPVDLVVSTRALDTVHAYDPADLTLTADAGVSLGQLERVTADQGQWLPLDPPGRARRSLGGVLASGAYGPLQGKFGTPRDHVLGLTLVTGDGRVLELGGRVVKNVAGYDLVKLAVGSSGRLGIVTSATVLLHPLPVRDVTLLYQTPRLALAVVLARSLATAPLRIPALELLAGHGEEPTVAVRLLGSPEAAAESERILNARVGRKASRRLEGEASARWFAALERFEDDAAAVARVSHLPSRLGDLVEPAVECGTVAAHVSLGVLRVAVRGPGASAAAVFDALTRLRDNVAQAGATFRVSRANIPRWPAPEPAAAPGVLALTRGIVDSFDPAGVLSRPAS